LIITGLAAAQNFNTDVNKEFEKAIGLYKAKIMIPHLVFSRGL
jgi:hypothetical protein